MNFVEKLRCVLQIAVITTVGFGVWSAQAQPFSGEEIILSSQAIELSNLSTSQIDTTRILTKAAVFESISSALETGVFMAFYGTTGTSTGAFFTISLLSAAAIYVVHEYAWEVFSSSQGEEINGSRVAIKTISYRAVGILKSFALGSLLGGAQVARSFGFVGTYAVLDSILYASAEYLDGLLSRARREESLPVLQ